MESPKEEIIYCSYEGHRINKQYCVPERDICDVCQHLRQEVSESAKIPCPILAGEEIAEAQCLGRSKPKEDVLSECQECSYYKDQEKCQPRKLRTPSYKQLFGEVKFEGQVIKFGYWFLSTDQVRRLLGLPSRPTKKEHKLLSGKLGISLRKKHTECLIRAIREYMELKKVLYLGSMPVNVFDNAEEIKLSDGSSLIYFDGGQGHPFTTSRVELKKIHKWAEEGIQLLEGINLCTLALLTPRMYHPDKPAVLTLVDKTNYILRWLRFFAAAQLEKIPPTKEFAKTDLPFIFLISALRETYEDATGKRAYGNIDRPFFKFVKTFLELIHESPDSEESLEALIKRALKYGLSPSTQDSHIIDFPI